MCHPTLHRNMHIKFGMIWTYSDKVMLKKMKSGRQQQRCHRGNTKMEVNQGYHLTYEDLLYTKYLCLCSGQKKCGAEGRTDRDFYYTQTFFAYLSASCTC